MSLELELRAIRLAAERAALRQLNDGYGFAGRRPLVETYFSDSALRDRLGRDFLRPADTHAEQLAAVERELADLEPAIADTPIRHLASRLDLEPLEIDLLRVVVAHALDGDVRDLCAALTPITKPALLLSTCQRIIPERLSDIAGVTEALHSRGRLRRLGAVATSGVGVGVELTATPELLSALVGDDRIPDRLADVAEDAAGSYTLIEDSRARVAEVAELAAAATRPPAIILKGVQGSGKRALALAIAEALGRSLIAVNGAALEGDDRLGEVLAFARLNDRLVYLTGIETIEERRIVRQVDEHDDLVLLATRETGIVTLKLERPAHLVAAPRPTLDVRTAIWRDGLAGIDGFEPADAETFAARYVIGAGAICEVLADAQRYATASVEPLTREHLEDAISRRLSLNLGVLGQRITRRSSFEEMVLPEDVLETLRDLIAMVEGRSQILETWGYERHLGLSRGVSALFSGAPGTGKTMAASVISSELGLELFRIDLSSVVSKWVGETEKNLARIFDEAQDAHAMLLFDEADSLFGKRTDVQNASDRYANLEVNYVLQRMEQFDGISVLTTNLEAGIDPAFMRRLNFRVRFPDPEEEERAELWRKLLPPESGLTDVDVTELAERFEMTGGHIRNAIVRAAVVASREGRAMEKDDLERGAHHEYYELGKVMHSSL